MPILFVKELQEGHHLPYVDNTLIFFNGKNVLVEGCVDFMDEYFLASRQKINAVKSSFIVERKAPPNRVVP